MRKISAEQLFIFDTSTLFRPKISKYVAQNIPKNRWLQSKDIITDSFINNLTLESGPPDVHELRLAWMAEGAVYDYLRATENSKIIWANESKANNLPYDIIIWQGDVEIKIDVKNTGNKRSTRLIWPLTKWEKYLRGGFDILIGTQLCFSEDMFNQRENLPCKIHGFTTYNYFLENHVTSDGKDRLKKNTKYLYFDDLNNIGSLTNNSRR